jgi:hypothetical protein
MQFGHEAREIELRANSFSLKWFRGNLLWRASEKRPNVVCGGTRKGIGSKINSW